MDFDVVIVGGGLAGASLAAALAASRTRVALIERRAPPPPGAQWDARVYTLTPASVAFLYSLHRCDRHSYKRHDHLNVCACEWQARRIESASSPSSHIGPSMSGHSYDWRS